jgi:hypothetical protein
LYALGVWQPPKSLVTKKPPKKRLYNDKENPKKWGSDHGEILIRLIMVVVYGVFNATLINYLP